MPRQQPFSEKNGGTMENKEGDGKRKSKVCIFKITNATGSEYMCESISLIDLRYQVAERLNTCYSCTVLLKEDGQVMSHWPIKQTEKTIIPLMAINDVNLEDEIKNMTKSQWFKFIKKSIKKSEWEILDTIKQLAPKEYLYELQMKVKEALIINGSLEDILMYIKRGDVNMRQEIGKKDLCGDVILKVAVEAERKDVVKILIDTGKDTTGNLGRIGSEALVVAINKNRLDIMTLLIDAKVDVNNEGGGSALVAACSNGQKDIVLALLEAGMNVQERIGTKGSEAFLAATMHCPLGYIDIAKILIDAKVDVNNECGGAALRQASRTAQTDILQMLVDTGLDVKKYGQITPTYESTRSTRKRQDVEQNMSHSTPTSLLDIAHPDTISITPLSLLDIAHPDTISILIDAKIDVKNESGYRALIFAVARDEKNVVAALTDAGINTKDAVEQIVAHKSTLLNVLEKAFSEKVDVIGILTDGCTKVPEFHRDEICVLAAMHGHNDIITKCLKGNIRKEKMEMAFVEASTYGHHDIVLTLIKANNDIKETIGRKALQFAILNDHADIVSSLMKSGFFPRKDFYAMALKCITKKGHADSLAILLESGMDIIKRYRNDGEIALGIASECGYYDIVTMLLDRKVDVTGEFGGVALECAAENGHVTIVASLVNGGVDITGEFGGEALILSAEHGHEEIVSMLIDRHADVKGIYGKLALEGATTNNHTDVIALLEKYR